MSYSRLNVVRKRAIEKTEEELQELRRIRAIPVAREAGVDGVPEELSYQFRSPRDVVISGPIEGLGSGPGRVFKTTTEAFHWAKDKYGEDRVTLIQPHEEAPRWAVLVKNLRPE